MKLTIKGFSTLFCVLTLSSSYSQNLVPNPSFEDTISCPKTGVISLADKWTNPTSYTPDYYHSCVPSSGAGDGFSVPNNWYGNQTAKTGVSYSGIILAYYGCSDCREYVQTKLLDTLEAGKKYIVSFFVCVSDSSPYAVNDVGAYFSNAAVGSSNNLVLPYTPQIANDPNSNGLSSKNTWINVQDTLTAIGGELYMTIGNFKNDVNSDTTVFQGFIGWIPYGYYYLDDVSVVEYDDSLDGVNSLVSLSSILIYPNPSSGTVNVDFPCNGKYQVYLSSVIGTIAYKEESIYILSGRKSYDFGQLAPGLYTLTIRNENAITTKKILINKN